MPDAKPKVESETPADIEAQPVAVISSVPLSVQIAPESLASLGAPPAGTAAPVSPEAAVPAAATGTPVNMTVMAPSPVPRTVTKGEGTTLSPTTTEAQDKVTEGQRHISNVWEYCQAALAIMVVGTTLVVISVLILRKHEQDITTNVVFLVTQLVVMATYIVTSYFTRTNHVNIGGVGPKANEPPYLGR